MKIILIRHGESEANIAHCINDDPSRPVNLTERGRAQAETAAGGLREMRFTHAYASEFPRAQQTAAILLRQHDCALQVDARLNERRSGMDGLPVHVFNDLEQMERVRSFLDEMAVRHSDGVILAVSHENPILAALALSSEDAEQAVLGSIANCEWVLLDTALL
jgi:broad specificity phosphatase PhoE